MTCGYCHVFASEYPDEMFEHEMACTARADKLEEGWRWIPCVPLERSVPKHVEAALESGEAEPEWIPKP